MRLEKITFRTSTAGQSLFCFLSHTGEGHGVIATLQGISCIDAWLLHHVHSSETDNDIKLHIVIINFQDCVFHWSSTWCPTTAIG